MTNIFNDVDPACVALAQAIINNPNTPLTLDMASCLAELTDRLGYDGQFKEYILKSEDNPKHPYVDTEGYITIGKGHKVNSLSEFLSIPFYIEGENRLATDEEKRQAYYVLRSYGRNNYMASYYANVTLLRLSENYRDTLYNGDILTRHNELSRGAVPNFNQMSAPMRRATMDVHYNAGISQFPNARAAARSFNKEEYCRNLHRLENNPNVRARNEWTYNECMNGDFIR